MEFTTAIGVKVTLLYFALASTVSAMNAVQPAIQPTTPTPTQNQIVPDTTDQLLANQRAQLPHRPAPPKPPTQAPPTPLTEAPPNPFTPTSDYIPPHIYPLTDGQCISGETFNNTRNQLYRSGYGLVYIDIGRPATCSGRGVGLEICYTVGGFAASSFELLLMRRDSDGSEYRVYKTYTIPINQPETTNEQSDVTCLFSAVDNPFSIARGDYIGFICNDDIKILFTPRVSETPGTLRLFNLSSETQQRNDYIQRQRVARQNSQTPQIDSIPSDQLQELEVDLAPLFRIIINESNMSSPTPSKTTTQSTPCTATIGGPTTIFTTAFTSLITASAVIILILLIIICLMGCYICKTKRKCFGCVKRFCICCRQRRVVHRITVQPITDQSMQYNDVYKPQDPRNIITRGQRYRTNIQDNPAYETTVSNRSFLEENSPTMPVQDLRRSLPSQDVLSTVTELSTFDGDTGASRLLEDAAEYNQIHEKWATRQKEPSPFEDDRNLDHTYEVIPSVRPGNKEL